MKKFLKSLFDDNNSINEKAIIGFGAFLVMLSFALADIITGSMGKGLIVNEFIYNSFLYLTLGCFGIATVDKFINKKNHGTEEEEQ